MSNAVLAADRVLNELGIVDPSDLRLLELIALERQAIVVEEPIRGAEARLVLIGSKAVITVSTFTENSQRKRFSIAHELGHLELHRGLSLLKLCESKDINDWKPHKQQVNRENEANEFAAALLLPGRFFRHLCNTEDPSLDYISELATQFDVSLTAATIQYCYFCQEPIAIVFSQKGVIRWFRANSDFEDLGIFVAIGNQVEASTQAGRFFAGRQFVSTPKDVQASAWLLPGGHSSEDTIREHSLAMSNYDAVLTLLWVNEEIGDDSDW